MRSELRAVSNALLFLWEEFSDVRILQNANPRASDAKQVKGSRETHTDFPALNIQTTISYLFASYVKTDWPLRCFLSTIQNKRQEDTFPKPLSVCFFRPLICKVSGNSDSWCPGCCCNSSLLGVVYVRTVYCKLGTQCLIREREKDKSRGLQLTVLGYMCHFESPERDSVQIGAV